jgi:O-antigen ligase
MWDQLEKNSVEFYIFFRFFVLILLTFRVLYFLKPLIVLAKRSKLFVAFSLFCVVRVTQTFFAPDLGVALFKATEFFVYYLTFVTIVLRRIEEPRNLIRCVYVSLFTLVVLSVLSALMFPEYGLRDIGLIPQIQGVFPAWNSNGLAQVTLLLVFMRFYLSAKISLANVLQILLLLLILIFCQTRSVLFPGLILLAYILWKYTDHPLLKLSYVYCMVAILFVIYVGFDIFGFYAVRGQDEATLATFSGRLVSWSYSLEYLTTKPRVLLLGLGPYTGYKEILGPDAFIFLDQSVAEKTLDNSYLELLLNSGVIGMLLLLYCLRLFFKSIDKVEEPKLQIFLFVVAIFILFRSFFVSSLLLHSNISFLLILAFASVNGRSNYGFTRTANTKTMIS